MTDFTIIAAGLQFPEGPVWMADGSVLVVEIKAGRISRIRPDGRVDVVATPGGGSTSSRLPGGGRMARPSVPTARYMSATTAASRGAARVSG